MGRGESKKAKEMKKNKPKYNLNHLIKERYPSFVDAIRDLDDPLSLIALYNVFSAHKLFTID